MRTANPLLRLRTFRRESDPDPDAPESATMRGAINNAAILTALLLLTCVYPLQRAVRQPLSAEILLALGAGVIMIYGVIMYVRRSVAPFAASVFAMGVGLTIGGLSAYLGREAGGLYGVAVLGSISTFIVMLWLHGVVGVDPGRRAFLAAHGFLGGMFLLFLITFALQPVIRDLSTTSGQPFAALGLSVAIVAMTTFCYIADFSAVRRGLDIGAPKQFEWYCAVGLVATLLWFVPESIRLVTMAHVRVRGSDEDSDADAPAAPDATPEP